MQSEDGKGPTWKAFVNFFKAMLGAGILSLPAIVTQTGIGWTILLWILALSVCTYDATGGHQ